MRYLLDTVTFIWALQTPERLSRKARAVFQDEDSILGISAISIAEIAIKNSCGKIDIGRIDIAEGLKNLRLRVFPFGNDHAARLFGLPMHHRDPFDRQIIAQALTDEFPVVTIDEKFRLYKGLSIVW